MWGTNSLKSISELTEGNENLILLIGVHWLMGCWQILLFTRQASTVKKAIIVPPQFIGMMNRQDYKTKRGIAISKSIFVIITLFAKLIFVTMKLSLNFNAFLWRLTENYSPLEIHRAAWYTAFVESADQMFLLPLNVCGYLLFSSKRVPLFLVVFEMLLEMLFGAMSAAQFTMFFAWMTEYYGAESLFYFPLLLNFIGLVFIAIYIQYVEPTRMQKLSNTPDVRLKDRLTTLTQDVNFPIDRIFVDETIPEANAYFVGIFGAKMIAVSSGLTRIMDAHSVAACVSHELGHWAHHHSAVLLLFSIVTVLCHSYGMLYSYDNPTVYQTFGFKDAPHAMIPLLLWLSYVSPLMLHFIGGVSSLVGCRCEYTADRFSVPHGLGPSLKMALMAMAAKARFYPFHDKWFSAWYHQHPTVLQRINRLDKDN